MQEFGISSHGVRINAFMYLTGGAGPHPLVIFLHGTPGNERNLDLAQAVRRAGYQVLYFDYRGDFGSGGNFSYSNGLEDTATILAWVRAPENVAKYHIDTTHIALVGHSDGAFFALMNVGHEPAGVCLAAMASWNAGWAAGEYAGHPDERAEAFSDYRSYTDPAGGPLHANADDLMNEIREHASEWNYLSQAAALKDRALLLVAATRDTPDEGVERHAELAAAIQNIGGKLVRSVTFDDDHPFSSHRIALADTLVHWLRTDCARTQGPAGIPK
jgi:uncharacterized protein